MRKKDFNQELKKMIGNMSLEEMEQTIAALNECKNKVYAKKFSLKKDIANLLMYSTRRESELAFTHSELSDGKIKIIGATILSAYEYYRQKENIPECSCVWWVINNYLISKKRKLPASSFSSEKAYIRPVLIMEDASEAGLSIGDSFEIKGDSFFVLTNNIALKTECLDVCCAYGSTEYKTSAVKPYVDSWYEKLITS